MADNASPWGEKILQSMKPGCVTFGWDDDTVITMEAPEETFLSMKNAWAWIDKRLREFQEGKGKPRSVCFRLADGEFRGLKFPDWNPGAM